MGDVLKLMFSSFDTRVVASIVSRLLLSFHQIIKKNKNIKVDIKSLDKLNIIMSIYEKINRNSRINLHTIYMKINN